MGVTYREKIATDLKEREQKNKFSFFKFQWKSTNIGYVM